MREQTIRIRFNSVFSFYQASLKFGDLNRSCNDKDKVNAPALWRGSLLIFLVRSRQIPREEISGLASFFVSSLCVFERLCYVSKDMLIVFAQPWNTRFAVAGLV